MATPSGPPLKRSRLTPAFSVTDSDAASILHNVQEISFPWEESMPTKISEWFNIISKAHNTRPEFMFVTVLSTTACLMGPDAEISVRETYSEPTNMFTVCIGQPGCGKSQAFRLAILDPLKEVGTPFSEIIVDDYTRRGLFNHLQSHDSRALCAHEEMSALFDTIQKRQLELSGERQLYCRLYDAGKWTNITGYQKQEARQQVDKVCLCIAGFLQPQPFIQRLYPALMESNDGFLDRFLICSPRPKLLLEEEVEEWCTKLSHQPLKSLSAVYQLITRWHRSSLPHVYTFSPQAKEQYRLFANEMTVLMNSQFEGSGGEVFGNYSKDKRTVIRLSGIIHVLYAAMNVFLDDETSDEEIPGVVTKIISQEEVQMAIALTEYFQAQRQAYEKVGGLRTSSSPDSNVRDKPSLAVTILLTKGAFVTPRSVIKNMTTKQRPQAEKVIEEMKGLEQQHIGKLKSITRTQTAFYKLLPSEENKCKVTELIGDENWDTYMQRFKEIDQTYITASQHNRLLDFADDKEQLESFGVVACSITTQ